MRVLLTGGAGYIGAHTAVALIEAGHDVLIVDDFSASSPEAVGRMEAITGAKVPVLAADARDKTALLGFVREHAPVDAVIHFAGLKAVGESMAQPVRYYDVNIGTALTVLEVMAETGIHTIVFSSSATVYGDPAPEALPLTEASTTGIDLANPYGKTKRMIEEILRDAAAADPRLQAVSLRYFNPVGAHPSGLIGEDPVGIPNNLMPILSRVAIGSMPGVSIYGDDYDTPDGTGLRDYIHVTDLAAGHVASLERARDGYAIFNLGTGKPVSVLELIEAFRLASGRPITATVAPRRAGDVASSYADPGKARRELDWSAELSIDQACADYWRWQERNPAGYRG